MTFSLIFTFMLASIALELTPGPNMTYIMLISSVEGKKKGFLMVAGIALGLSIIGFLCAFGAAAILETAPYLYKILGWVGVLYMLWLSYECWKSSAKNQSLQKKGQNYFAQGLITNILNPKAIIFFSTVLPSFANAHQSLLPQTITLTFIYVGIATVVHIGLVFIANGLSRTFSTPNLKNNLRQIFSFLLLIIALWLGYLTYTAI